MVDETRFSMSTRKAFVSLITNSSYGGVIFLFFVDLLDGPNANPILLVLSVAIIADACRSVVLAIKRLIERDELCVEKQGVLWKGELISWKSVSGYNTLQHSYMGINFQSGRKLVFFDHNYKLASQAASSLWDQLKLRYSNEHKINIDISFVTATNEDILEAMDRYYYPDGKFTSD